MVNLSQAVSSLLSWPIYISLGSQKRRFIFWPFRRSISVSSAIVIADTMCSKQYTELKIESIRHLKPKHISLCKSGRKCGIWNASAERFRA
jgi:hypothetical protein